VRTARHSSAQEVNTLPLQARCGWVQTAGTSSATDEQDKLNVWQPRAIASVSLPPRKRDTAALPNKELVMANLRMRSGGMDQLRHRVARARKRAGTMVTCCLRKLSLEKMRPSLPKGWGQPIFKK
jgi:hypothetical protein